MQEQDPEKEALMREVKTLRARVAALEQTENEHQQMGKRLRAHEERFQKIFTYSNDAIFLLDPSTGEILDVNPRACSMLGYARDELLSLNISKIHPNEMPQFRSFAESVLNILALRRNPIRARIEPCRFMSCHRT